MKLFATSRSEKFNSILHRLIFNFFPAYRRSGGRVTFISSDWLEVHVKLKLIFGTRNYVGSVFGGSIYASIDPIYMLQLIKILGKNYVVWDKSASIKFVKPIRKQVQAKFALTNVIIQEITNKVAELGEYTIDLPVQYEDNNGQVYAAFIKTLYIADKHFYKNKLANKKF